MAEFGHFSLCLAWICALVGIFSGVYAGMTRRESWFGTVRNATWLTTLATGIATAVLCYGFYVSDFTNQYIWQHSNRDMHWAYRISALWGGMDGSMLLWAFMLSVSAALLAALCGNYPRQLMPWVLAVLNSSQLFFLTVVVFLTNPFRYIRAEFIPPDGNGLNPLLQNPYMVSHPPMLYAGFTTLTVPFAFCLGALFAGYLSNEWIRLTRLWTLIGWCFLTVGIILGGHWAYVELGWGGFWAWDPVENASFMPWLTATAFLHSVMIQERKEMLKMWNVWLVVLTYGLTVFGTFLTRSGVVQSVHAFANTDVGWVFLLYLGIIFTTTIILTWWRRSELRSARAIESLLSREALFLLNNVVFLSICFATMWGVMFPVLSEAVTGNKQTVGVPFFNAVNVPLFLLLIFLMAIGPMIAWRKASWSSLVRTFRGPFLLSLLVCVLLVFVGIVDFYPLLAYGLSLFSVLTVAYEFSRAMRVQRAANPQGSMLSDANLLLRRHRARYGGYVVHIGVAIAAVSITSAMAFKTEKEFSLSKGETLEVGRFALTLNEVGGTRNDSYEAAVATMTLAHRKDRSPITTLYPERRFYFRTQEPTTEVALRIGLREDFYIALAGMDESGERVSFKIFINPLQVWLWFGGLVIVFGTVMITLPELRFKRAMLGAFARQEIRQ